MLNQNQEARGGHQGNEDRWKGGFRIQSRGTVMRRVRGDEQERCLSGHGGRETARRVPGSGKQEKLVCFTVFPIFHYYFKKMKQ